jgi:hypothetical protein
VDCGRLGAHTRWQRMGINDGLGTQQPAFLALRVFASTNETAGWPSGQVSLAPSTKACFGPDLRVRNSPLHAGRNQRWGRLAFDHA